MYQVLLIRLSAVADSLSTLGCFGWICVSLPFASSYPWAHQAQVAVIQYQLVAKSIIVMPINSICVYGPTRSTQSASQGLVIASFVGSLLYLCCLHVFTWQLCHFLSCDWTVVLGPFQYIEIQRVSSRCFVPGCCR